MGIAIRSQGIEQEYGACCSCADAHNEAWGVEAWEGRAHSSRKKIGRGHYTDSAACTAQFNHSVYQIE